jgi:structure-specific recognition protein 1
MADASSELLKFTGISHVGKAGTGLFKITSNQFGWKCTEAGLPDSSVQYSGSDLLSAEWQKACGRKCLLKLGFKDDGGRPPSKFIGFEQKDMSSLQAHLSKYFKVTLAEIPVATIGWSWGDLKLDSDSEIRLMVNDKLGFEVPLAEVNQVTVAGKSDVNLEMQLSSTGTADEVLHEIRFQLAPDWISPEALREDLSRKAGGALEKGDALGRVSDVMLVAPRGKHDLEFFRQAMKVHGKTQTYSVRYVNIARLFLLTLPGNEVCLVLGLDQPLRQGQQLNNFLVFTMPKDLAIVPNLREDKMKAYDMPLGNTQPVHVILAKLLKDMSAKPIIAPASELVTANGCHCIRASHKAQAGNLFPMKKSMIFITKPVVWIRYDDIDRIEFVKGVQRGRSFDVIVFRKSQDVVEFAQMEVQDIQALANFWKDVGLKLENMGEVERAANPRSYRPDSTAASSSAPPRHRIAQKAAPAKKDAAVDEGDDEDDEDFDDDFGDSSSEGVDDGDSIDSEDVMPQKKRAKKAK